MASSVPSFVFFGDEQDTGESLLFGGFFLSRAKLFLLDGQVAAAGLARNFM